MTANEVASVAASGGNVMAESVRKRVKELLIAGRINKAGERQCEITGQTVMTYTTKEQQ